MLCVTECVIDNVLKSNRMLCFMVCYFRFICFVVSVENLHFISLSLSCASFGAKHFRNGKKRRKTEMIRTGRNEERRGM